MTWSMIWGSCLTWSFDASPSHGRKMQSMRQTIGREKRSSSNLDSSVDDGPVGMDGMRDLTSCRWVEVPGSAPSPEMERTGRGIARPNQPRHPSGSSNAKETADFQSPKTKHTQSAFTLS